MGNAISIAVPAWALACASNQSLQRTCAVITSMGYSSTTHPFGPVGQKNSAGWIGLHAAELVPGALP